MDDYFDATDPRQTAYESDRAQLLSAMLARAGDEGWTQTALARAAGDVAMPPERVALVFPDGVEDVLAYDSAVLDRAMVARLLPATLENLRIRARIALGLRLRIEALSSQEAAAHRAAAMLALPRFAPLGLRLAYQTIDRLWRAIGDTSTDFNFYTKRGLTVGVYLATLAAWFSDKSPDKARAWATLDAQIDKIMMIEGTKIQLRKFAKYFPSPWPIVAMLRYPDATSSSDGREPGA